MDEIKIDDAIFMVTLSFRKNEYSLDVFDILPMAAQYCSLSPFGKIVKFPGWEGKLSQICVRVPAEETGHMVLHKKGRSSETRR